MFKTTIIAPYKQVSLIRAVYFAPLEFDLMEICEMDSYKLQVLFPSSHNKIYDSNVSSIMTQNVPIKLWANDDKPREKLLQKGRQALSDAELIAILLGTGTQKQHVLALAHEVLRKANHSLCGLSQLSINDLKKIPGIGPAKALIIYSAMELARRRKHEAVKEKAKLATSHEAYQYIYMLYSDLHHEEFWVTYLNKANKILDCYQLSKGGIDATVIDLKLLCKKAVELTCSSVIVSHNHPSGNTSPSPEDRKITTKIQQALAYFDIKLLDHIIVGEQQYFSFADEGVL